MYRTLVAILLVQLALVVCLTSAIETKTCKDFPAFTSIQVSDCEGEVKRCPFVKGGNVSMNATFQSGIDTQNITIAVWGRLSLLRIKTPFPINPSSACKLGVACPVAANTTHTFQLRMPILRIYPSVNVDVGVELWGDNDTRIACVVFPSTIVSSK